MYLVANRVQYERTMGNHTALSVIMHRISSKRRVTARQDHHPVQTILVHFVLYDCPLSTRMYINPRGLPAVDLVALYHGAAHVLDLDSGVGIGEDSVSLDPPKG